MKAPGDASQLYRFKDIQKVASASDLIDIVLSRTQRKTATVVHPQYDIRRIRSFYMTKVKYCQTTFHEKFAAILTQFPKLDDIHPFYANLCNVLYDKDHYKLALGQVNTVRGAIDNMAKEYVKFLKYADSAYKCKMLKRAALGRMCTVVKKLKASLTYLEEVRQHLSRLPGINPFSPTILLAGFPNVGKSTFMNAVSAANVETAEWAFTTQNLFVGHFDYQYQPWQVIDTPGILDRPLEARNTIELTAVTAMAYLNCSVLFLVDISGHCGYTVVEQVSLFRSLKKLLERKPVVIVLNKVDLRPVNDLTEEESEAIKSMAEGLTHVHFVAASAALHENLDDAKNKACELLKSKRIEKRILAGKMGVSESVYVAAVTPNPARPANIPEGVFLKGDEEDLPSDVKREEMDESKEAPRRMLEKDRAELEGGSGVYISDDRKGWLLDNEEWKYDVYPQFFMGKNVADFIDPDIESKLKALEEEEAELEATFDVNTQAPTDDWIQLQETMEEIYNEIKTTKAKRARLVRNNGVIMPRPKRVVKLRPSSKSGDQLALTDGQKRQSFAGISRLERTFGDNLVQRDAVLRQIASVRKGWVKNKKLKNSYNESDRFIGTKKPKHLFSGKRSSGKTDWR